MGWSGKSLASSSAQTPALVSPKGSRVQNDAGAPAATATLTPALKNGSNSLTLEGIELAQAALVNQVSMLAKGEAQPTRMYKGLSSFGRSKH